MSFIGDVKKGEIYAPGYFLAHGDEGVTRETKEIAQNSALVVTSEDGTKHVPMGTAYPTNDGNAIGILYEDVDVTAGNMPGSVVTAGAEVYEDRLAITGAQYDAVTLKDLVSPKAEGWYESDGQVDPTYTLSTDTTVNTSKTYYSKSGDTYSAVSDYAAVLNPKTEGWYERSGSSPNYVYTLSTDTEGDSSKTYYEKSDVRLASAAKSALAALGFKFVATAPAVTRPY
jgi:hypothetical protein